MARFHYDLTGCEPIIRDVQLFDAALIQDGEFIMQSATAASKQSFITGYVDSAASMVNGLGIAMETINTSGSVQGPMQGTTQNLFPASDPIDSAASIATTQATGARYGKAIINPFAVYLAEYSQAAADDETATTNEAADTTITMTAIEQAIEGGWIYSTHLSPVAAERGQLRYVAAAAANTLTYLTAATYTAASTTLIKILPSNHELVDLTADALGISTDLAASSCISLKVLQSYIAPNGVGYEVLREALHDSSVTYDSLTRFYSDIVLLNSAYNTID